MLSFYHSIGLSERISAQISALIDFQISSTADYLHGISVLELGVFAKPSGIMALSAKVSVPNAVEGSSSGSVGVERRVHFSQWHADYEDE